MPDLLEYSSPRHRQSPWTRLIRHALLALLIVAALAPLTLVTVQFRTTSIDAIIGARQITTTWFGLFTLGPTVTPSPLATRLKTLTAATPYTPQWQTIESSGFNLLGMPTWRGHGRAPAVMAYKPIIDLFAAIASDEELRNYLQIMQSGTPEQQEQLLREIADRILTPTTVPSSP